MDRVRLYPDVCFKVELGSTSLPLFVSDEGHSGKTWVPFNSLAHREDAKKIWQLDSQLVFVSKGVGQFRVADFSMGLVMFYEQLIAYFYAQFRKHI